MLSTNKRESLILLIGDVLCLFLSLFLSLYLRAFEFPDLDTLLKNLSSWSFIFAITILSFFIAGLYEKHRSMLRKKIPELLFNAEIVNAVIAIIFFYFTPVFGVSPKTILFIYIVVSFGVLFFWRMLALNLFFSREKEGAILIARGGDAQLLENEINENPRYSFKILERIDVETRGLDFNKDVLEKISNRNVRILIVDSADEKISGFLPNFYDLIFSRITFLEMHDLYEEVFDRVPVSLLDYGWFLEHISATPREVYDLLKRLMDILISIPLFIISLVFYPLIYIAELFEGNRTLFSFQERVGQFGKKIRLIKFRTMLYDDNGDWQKAEQNKVTKVGKFLRMIRLDELPQLWNVLKGDISLIGPRPEFPKAVDEYEKQIPYYGVRHIIKPGLSGWAQIYGEHPHHGIGVNETKNKLSYDLFYIKRRSLLLDLIIALKTIKTLLSRQGI